MFFTGLSIWTALKALLYTLLATFIILELISLTRLYKRKQQGFDIMYFPVIGVVYHFIFRRKHQDDARWIKEKIRKNDFNQKKGIAFNLPIIPKPLVLIQDSAIIGEILARETEICVRKNFNNKLDFIKMGNFFDYSERGMAMRGAFTGVFRAENMDKMTPKVQEIVDKVIDSIEQNPKNLKQIQEKGYFDVDLKGKISEMFKEILDKILFGVGVNTLIDGIPLADQILQAFTDVQNLFTDPVTVLTLGLLIYLRATPKVRSVFRRLEKIRIKILELYKAKEKDESVQENNFLGGILHYNREHPDDPIDDEEIVGNIMLMVFAAFDTSRHSTGWALKFLSLYQNEQEDLRREAEELKTFEGGITGPKLEKSAELSAWIKESMRLGAPFAFTKIREMVKSVKIKGVKLQKGDWFSVCLLYNQFKETDFPDFPDAFRFDRTRHYKPEYSRNNQMPFSGGKRSCIGKYLALMNIKIIVLSFMRRYRVETDESFDDSNLHIPFHTLKKVMVRLRKLE